MSRLCHRACAVAALAIAASVVAQDEPESRPREDDDTSEQACRVAAFVARGRDAVPELLAAWRLAPVPGAVGRSLPRTHAAWALGLIGPASESAVPQLAADVARMMDHPDVDPDGIECQLALWALRAIGASPKTLLPLARRGLAPAWRTLVRIEAAYVLSDLGRSGAGDLGLLVDGLVRGDAIGRDVYADALARAGRPAVAGLVSVVRGQHARRVGIEARAAAARALGRIDGADARADAALAEALEAKPAWACWLLRQAAVRALADRGVFSPALALRMVSLIETDYEAVEMEARCYLACLSVADKRAARAVLVAATDRDDADRRLTLQRGLRALLRAQGEAPAWDDAIGEGVLAALSDPDPRVAQFATRTLADFAERDAVRRALAARRHDVTPESIAAPAVSLPASPRDVAALLDCLAKASALASGDATRAWWESSAVLRDMAELGPRAGPAARVLLRRVDAARAEPEARDMEAWKAIQFFRAAGIDPLTSELHALAAILPAGATVDEAFPVLLPILRDPAADQYDRVAAAACIAAYGAAARTAVPDLVQLLQPEAPLPRTVVDRDLCQGSRLRAEAAEAFARIGPPAASAVPALVRILEQEGPSLWVLPAGPNNGTEWSTTAGGRPWLLREDGSVAVADGQRRLRWPTAADIPAAVCRALAALGPAAAAAVPVLEQRARDGVMPGTRDAARAALVGIRGK